jgi:hypothetical protein
MPWGGRELRMGGDERGSGSRGAEVKGRPLKQKRGPSYQQAAKRCVVRGEAVPKSPSQLAGSNRSEGPQSRRRSQEHETFRAVLSGVSVVKERTGAIQGNKGTEYTSETSGNCPTSPYRMKCFPTPLQMGMVQSCDSPGRSARLRCWALAGR